MHFLKNKNPAFQKAGFLAISYFEPFDNISAIFLSASR
jgi:hypothetical protein